MASVLLPSGQGRFFRAEYAARVFPHGPSATSPARGRSFEAMTYQGIVAQGQDWLGRHYAGYAALPPRERRALAAGWVCDVLRPREATGHNDGPEVQAILEGTGLHGDNPWCAAAQALIADVSRTWRPKEFAASVAKWRSAADLAGRRLQVRHAGRGDLVTKDYGKGKGHMALVLVNLKVLVKTAEGNTSPGEAGSQRDGQGFYRRWRLSKWWTDAIAGY